MWEFRSGRGKAGYNIPTGVSKVSAFQPHAHLWYGEAGTYARSIAHCSIFARACNIATRFFKLPPFPLLATLAGSTFVKLGRGGVSGGLSRLFRPIDTSSPVVKSRWACRVRATFRIGSPVLRMRIAHSTSVLGGLVGGMMGSELCDSMVDSRG